MKLTGTSIGDLRDIVTRPDGRKILVVNEKKRKAKLAVCDRYPKRKPKEKFTAAGKGVI